jgi:glyoxylase-like metal-dependent hydrolase (beta-lactamase superfamily II)
MAEIKILVEGYVADEEGGHSCSTITLVRDKDIVMIVDPGSVKDQKIIVDALKKEGLGVGNINIVCTTHSHTDHYMSMGMFPNAKVLDYHGWWIRDVWKKRGNKVSDDIEIVETPGHRKDSITLLVKTDQGKIAICGDVFWKKDYPKTPEDDPYADDRKTLKKTRKKVLEMADYIIPGHGRIFRVKN